MARSSYDKLKDQERRYSRDMLLLVGLVGFIVGLAYGVFLSQGRLALRVGSYVPPTTRGSILASAEDTVEIWLAGVGAAESWRNLNLKVTEYQSVPRAEREPGEPRVEAAIHCTAWRR
jgi:hypothetical protein